MRATKKPITIEYYPCEEKYFDEILKWWTKERPINKFIDDTALLEIKTLEWRFYASDKDMIIKWIDWECYPCKKDIFKKTYDIIWQD